MDVVGGRSSFDELQASGGHQVEVPGVVKTGDCGLGELPRDLGTDAIAARADRRTEVNHHLGGRDLSGGAQRLEGCTRRSRHRAAPSGMSGRHAAVGSEEQRKAVGPRDRQRNSGDSGHEHIAAGMKSRTLHFRDQGAMHLAGSGERIWVELERFEEAAAVFRHRFGSIFGRAAEVQRVERWAADSATPGGEREHRFGLRDAGAPGRRVGVRIKHPHDGMAS